MSAQASSDTEIPLLEAVVVGLSVDIGNTPYDPDDPDAFLGILNGQPVLQLETPLQVAKDQAIHSEAENNNHDHHGHHLVHVA
jgi:hypothetical protein